MNKTEMNELLSGTVDDIKPELQGMSDAQLAKLHDAEEQGLNRSTLLNAIDVERQKYGSTEKTAESFRESFPSEWEAGRRARQSSISRDDAPYNTDTDQLSAWQEGYDSFEDNGAQLRMQTGSADPQSLGQTATVAEANKA